MVDRQEQINNPAKHNYSSVVQKPLLNYRNENQYQDTYEMNENMSYRQESVRNMISQRNGLVDISKLNRALDSPTSDIRLLRRKESIKTEQEGSVYRDRNQDSNSLKDDLHIYGPPQKLNTLKAPAFLQNGVDRDLRNKNVETNIDPSIIHQQQEDKEPYHDDSLKKSFGSNSKAYVAHLRKSSKFGSQIGNENNPSENKSKHDIESQKSKNILGILQAKKTDLFANIAEEEDDVLNLQLQLDEEQQTHESNDGVVMIDELKRETFILSHAGKFRIRWDLWIIVLVIYNCIQIPLEIAFQEEFATDGLEYFGYFVDSQFVIDIIFNFRTTFINERTGLEVVRGKIIALTYLKQWRFYFDLLSIIPFEFLYNITNDVEGGGGSSTQFKIFDLLKLIRLLRLGRIITYLKFNSNIKTGFRIVQLLFMLLLIVHWVGCIWYLIIDGSSWMPPYDANYGFTDFHELNMWRKYAIVFYYAILLLLGGDILPVSTLSTVYGSLIVIAGSIVTAFIFGNMAALMAAMNQKDSQFQEQYDNISNLMRAIKLPVNTQAEVEAYLMHIQQVPDMQQDMRVFLKLLSPSLRNNILFHMYKAVINKISIFDQCSNIELRFIVNFMKTVIFLPGDEIIRQGDKGSKIYFISRGIVQVFIGNDDANLPQQQSPQKEHEDDKSNKTNKLKSTFTTVINENQQLEGGEDESKSVNLKRKNQLTDDVISQSQNANTASSQKVSDNGPKFIKDIGEGDYFGEIALMTNLKRTATIKAKDFTTLGYIMQRNFLQTKEEFPQIYQSFKKQIKVRYSDENFKFRQKMIQNVPYFRNLSEAVVQELVYLLRPNRYDPNMLVVKRGDSTDRIFFLKSGTIDVEVPLKNSEKMHFDTLNPGSCFCIFSAFDEDKKQKFDFRARNVCIVESITAKDIIGLQKEYLELSDEIKALMIQIQGNEKSEFDFFRYVPRRVKDENNVKAQERRQIIRKKFRMAIARFFRKLKQSKALLHMMNLNKNADKEKNKEALYNHILGQGNQSDDDSDNDDRKHFKALHALDQLEKERKDKDQKLRYLKEKCSNPSLFALTALLGKKRIEKKETEAIQNSPEDKEQSLREEESKQNTERKQGLDFNNRKDNELNNNDVSIEMDISNYPRIDGIRRELTRIKEESMLNTQDINEQSGFNNLSQLNQDTLIASKHKKEQKRRIGDNIRIPDFDRVQTNMNKGDDSLLKMTTTLQDLSHQQQNNTYGDYLKLDDISVGVDDNTVKNQKQKHDQSWKGKIGQLNLSKVNEERQNQSQSHRELPKQKSLLGMNPRTKTLQFDNVTMKKIEEAEKKENESKLNNEGSQINNGDDLINVLNEINKNLVNQQENMNQLQKDMTKKMQKLERKLNKAIQIDGGRSSKSPTTYYSNSKNFISDQQRLKLIPQKEYQIHISDSSEPNIIEKYSNKDKRIASHPQKLGSMYAQSECQFIQDKNAQSPLLRVQSSVVPRAQSQNPQPILKNRLNQYQPSSNIDSPLPNVKILQSSQTNSQQQSQGFIKMIKTPLILQSDSQDEEKHIILESDSSDRQEIRVNLPSPNDQLKIGEQNPTPYFTTEYQETLINEYVPSKPVIKGQDQIEILSDRASTNHKEMATKGPQVTQSIQRQQDQKQSFRNYASYRQTPDFGAQGYQSHNLNFQRDESQIDINENDLNNEYLLQDNTVNFEDQLDKSLERLNQLNQENNINGGAQSISGAGGQYYFQNQQVEYKYLCQNLQLQIYLQNGEGLAPQQTPAQMINQTLKQNVGQSGSNGQNSARMQQNLQNPQMNNINPNNKVFSTKNSLKTVKNNGSSTTLQNNNTNNNQQKTNPSNLRQ